MLFPTTNWSQIIAHSQSGDHLARESLDRICRAYWKPVHAIVRLSVRSEHDAQDLTQSFFLHVIERSAFEKADRLKGRFRDYLRAILSRFLSNEWRTGAALKRGGGAVHEELDHEHPGAAGPADQDEVFDREWAHLVMSAALSGAREACEGRGHPWEVFKSFLPGGGGTVSYEDGAARTGLSMAAFKMETHRLRQNLKTLLRTEVARTVTALHEIDDELAYLRAVLERSS